VVATRMLPPASRMAPLTDAEFAAAIDASPLAAKLGQAVDRESAREMLAARMGRGPAVVIPDGGMSPGAPSGSPAEPTARPREAKPGPSAGAQIAATAGVVLGGLLKFATSRSGQTLIRGVLGTPTRTRRR